QSRAPAGKPCAVELEADVRRGDPVGIEPAAIAGTSFVLREHAGREQKDVPAPLEGPSPLDGTVFFQNAVVTNLDPRQLSIQASAAADVGLKPGVLDIHRIVAFQGAGREDDDRRVLVRASVPPQGENGSAITLEGMVGLERAVANLEGPAIVED